ncbi:prolipoprotein diacylglyceryl transferase family protein [Ruminococcus albus]|uniref:Prolipoprotein diacylglyceryltransferase n=1 Tax=Ruminococcus albus TaxID=1264 RepID=A0A1H7L8K4_RUMAL|nr:prolipoprotein diacylglyceryl transferase family protein [Ruminococcus albus]SEK94805.1 Prolipoprotein diacylglyceryltransferase [Ruminococcus albus]
MHIHINTTHSHIQPYGVMIIMSFLVGAVGMYILNKRKGVQKRIALYMLLLLPVMSLFCAVMLTYITSGGKSYGLSSVGGLVGVYAAVITMGLISPSRNDLPVMAETATVMLPLMYSVSKIGCFLAGCCHGFDYDGIFAVEYSGRNAHECPAFPVQASETLTFLIIFLIGVILYTKKKRYAVQVIFITSASAKCALDFLRASHEGIILSLTQIFCIILAFIGIVWLILKMKKANA